MRTALTAFCVLVALTPIAASAAVPPTLTDSVAINGFGCFIGNQGYIDGQSVETAASTGSFSVSLRNLTNTNLIVEYRIFSQTAGVDTGVVSLSGIPPSTAQSQSGLWVPWTLVNGTHEFIVELDPNRKLPESEEQRKNNRRKFTLTLSLISYATVSASEVAAAVGAPWNLLFFNSLVDPVSELCHVYGPAPDSSRLRIGIMYLGPVVAPATYSGCKLVTQVFHNVSLRNGWVIHEVVLEKTPYYQYSGNPIWILKPGGDSLHGQLDLHFAGQGNIDNYVRIVVTGPRGTQPAFAWANPLRLR